MQALGLIETKGLLAAIESADAMLKAANVSIVEKTYVGGGLVSITVTGDVGAVKAAVESGIAAVKKLDSKLLFSYHVIPRPHDELENIIGIKNTLEEIVLSSKSENKECKPKDKKYENQVCINKDFKENEKIDNTDYIMDDSEEVNLKEENSLIENSLKQINTDLKIDLNNLQKVTVDNLVKEIGIEKTIKMLTKLKVAKLRELACQYKDFNITEIKISKASKKLLITKLKAYYQ